MLKKFDNLAVLLLVSGGIAWGLVGVYRFNLVTYVFNHDWIIRLIYVIFGLSVVYHLIAWGNQGKKKKPSKR